MRTSVPAQVRPRRSALAPRRDERLVGALQDPLRADVDPRAGRHLAVHHQALAPRARGSAPTSPTCRRGSSSRSARAARRRACGTRRPACPTARAASRRRSSALQLAHDHVERLPDARRLAGAAVDDEVLRAARRPRGRGCSCSMRSAASCTQPLQRQLRAAGRANDLGHAPV